MPGHVATRTGYRCFRNVGIGLALLGWSSFAWGQPRVDVLPALDAASSSPVERSPVVSPKTAAVLRITPDGFNPEALLGDAFVKNLVELEQRAGLPALRLLLPGTSLPPESVRLVGPIDLTLIGDGEPALIVTTVPAGVSAAQSYLALNDLAAALGLTPLQRGAETFFGDFDLSGDTEELDAALASHRTDNGRPWQEALAGFPGAHLRFAFVPTLWQREFMRLESDRSEGELGLPVRQIERDVVVFSAGLRLSGPVSGSVSMDDYLLIRLTCRNAAAAERTAVVVRDQLARFKELLGHRSDLLTILLTKAIVKIEGSNAMVRLDLTPDLIASLQPSLAKEMGLNTESQKLIETKNKFKQALLAFHNYHDTHDRFPLIPTGGDVAPKLSWRVALLPYLEQDELYRQFHLDESWDSPHNSKLLSKMPDIYKDPMQDLPAGMTTMQVPVGPHLIADGEKATALPDVTDGLSNTILLIQMPAEQAVFWTRPDDWEVTEGDSLVDAVFGDGMDGGARRPQVIVASTDGAIHVLRDTFNDGTFRPLITRDGGEPVVFSDARDPSPFQDFLRDVFGSSRHATRSTRAAAVPVDRPATMLKETKVDDVHSK